MNKRDVFVAYPHVEYLGGQKTHLRGEMEVSQEIGSGHARASDTDGKKCGPARAPHQAAWRLRTESGPHTARCARLQRL